MTTLINQIIDTCERVTKPRDYRDVLTSVMEEVGELATEVAIECGHKNRDPSPDGIVGEALDTIISAVDMIYQAYKVNGVNFDKAEIEDLLKKRAVHKLAKWEKNAYE